MDVLQRSIDSTTTSESPMPNSSIVPVFLASISSVGTAVALTGSGFYLHRRGYVTEEGKKVMARYSQQVALPALFFSKMIDCPKTRSGMSPADSICPSLWETISVGNAGLLVIWPCFVVGMGLLVGKLACRWSHTPKDKEHIYIVAVAFSNSTGLVTTLLSVLQEHAPLSQDNLDRQMNPHTTYIDPNSLLSLYLVLYPMLQWGLGGWILSTEKDNVQCGYRAVPVSVEPGSENSRTIATCDEDGEPMFHDDEALVRKEHTLIQSSVVETHDSSPAGGDTSTLHNKICTAIKKTIIDQPPVSGALLGIFVSLIPTLRSMWVNTSLPASTSAPVPDAPLGWLFDAVVSLGKSAIPINMAVLGANLSITTGCKLTIEKRRIITFYSAAAVVMGKLVLMPLVGFSSVYILEKVLEALSTPPLPPSMMLVMMIVFLTPTANTVMIMVDLADGLKEEMARLLAVQYLFAPFLLSCSVAVAVKQSNFLQ